MCLTSSLTTVSDVNFVMTTEDLLLTESVTDMTQEGKGDSGKSGKKGNTEYKTLSSSQVVKPKQKEPRNVRGSTGSNSLSNSARDVGGVAM